mmetsp:Transcript_32125/g.47261  ORF Transcript_32125/g.47261 Transcript_32125/m.47261 type:complete len:93 (-) Transcript_32125:424-702(-)
MGAALCCCKKKSVRKETPEKESRSKALAEPLVSKTEAIESPGSEDSSSGEHILPLDEESLHSDPLYWAKSKTVDSDEELSWSKEGDENGHSL